MKYTNTLPIVCLIVGLSACVTDRGAPSFTAAPVPSVHADKAVLYIYRENAEPTAWSAYLQLDGKRVASLAQQGFTWVYVTPGPHKMKFGWPALAGMPKVDFQHTFEAGQVYAFEMIGQIDTNGLSYRSLSAVAPIEFEFAQKKMTACCRFVPASKS
jgi:hypothetical protein